MKNENETEKLAKSLLKKAMGYTVDEVVEEYAGGTGGEDLKLIKKKVTKKHIPPDINAARALLERCFDTNMNNLRDFSDEELQKMRAEILQQIKKEV